MLSNGAPFSAAIFRVRIRCNGAARIVRAFIGLSGLFIGECH